jgi:hypothetical protein
VLDAQEERHAVHRLSISLRGDTSVTRTGFDEFTWDIEIVKDKRRGPGWSHSGLCRGVEGLH